MGDVDRKKETAQLYHAGAQELRSLASNHSRHKHNMDANKTSTPGQKKICCACPETKSARDECVLMYGEDKCGSFIDAHKMCLRKEGFDVK